MAAKKSPIVAVADAAKVLKITPRQVQNMIKSGVLPAQKLGREYMILRSDLEQVPKVRKRGPKRKDQDK
jgi:excisionase family DNA binding protein